MRFKKNKNRKTESSLYFLKIDPARHILLLILLLCFIVPLCGIAGKARIADAANLSPEQGNALKKVRHASILTKFDQGEAYVNVIVRLKEINYNVSQVNAKDHERMAIRRGKIRSQQNGVLMKVRPSNFLVKHQLKNFPGFSGRVTREGLMSLISMPEVELVEEDVIVTIHTSEGIPVMNASTIRSSYDGTGVSVAIVDTGIDYTHPMLGNGSFPNDKVIGGYDFGDYDSDPIDCEGHGTSVAGIVAGTQAAGPGSYIGGVAHNAKIYALKIVSGCDNSAFSSDIAAAWDWAITHKNDDPDNPILVINTSFGGGKYTAACDSIQSTLASVADRAVENGITLMVSSGNEAYIDGISSPACVTNAISVGAVYDDNVGSYGYSVCSDATTAADQVTCYSNSADFLDILAPSHNAYTTAVGGGYSVQFGGTSAASPYAAGAAAILQSYAKSTTGSYYTSAELKTKILDGGDLITDPRNGISKPRVNVAIAACINTYYIDLDGDGFGDPGTSITTCIEQAGYVLDDTDCDDNDPAISPATYWYQDNDGDGFGTSTIYLQQCTEPGGSIAYVLDNNDYDDNDPLVGAPIRINDGTLYYYSSLQTAYDAALDSDTIEIIAVTFTEDLFIDIDKSVIFFGGYDGAFTTNYGMTTLNGDMSVTEGGLTFDYFILE